MVSGYGYNPFEVFDGIRLGSITDRSQPYKDLAAGLFIGANRPGAKVSQGMRKCAVTVYYERDIVMAVEKD